MCALYFEYVYFARTDSVIDKQCVYQARINMGRELAKETKEIHPDIVISVPDSGTAAAVGYSLESGVPFMEGLTKIVMLAVLLFSQRKSSV